MVKVAIQGATAYTSLELIKLLARHPEVEISHLGGRREGEPRISEIFPQLQGICDMALGGLEPDELDEEPDVAFFTLPHGVSHTYVKKFAERRIRCIDFSADYRFDDLEIYENYYGEHGDPEHFGTAPYGIPELFREDIQGASLVGNPGCYPTSVILGLAPLVSESLIEVTDIVVDSKSGVSGRGNKPSPGSMYCECNENLYAYKVGVHRHAPEMERGLNLLGADRASVCFTPHLVPMDRGILSTIYVRITQDMDTEALYACLRDYYGKEPFIRVKPPGEQPRTKDVSFTNYCDITVVRVGGYRAVVTSAVDNLLRGASSQAVQNMNVMLGLNESLGL